MTEESSLEAEHRPEAIAERLASTPTSHVSDWVLGAVDGVITTFAIVAGVVGAGLAAGVVVVLGVANLLADGLSMAASRFLGAQADVERRRVARQREERHISLVPEGEREEVRQLLAAKGFRGDSLEDAVEVVTADRSTWVEFMLTEELGFAPVPERPWAAGLATLGGFIVAGSLPVLPYVVEATPVDLAGPAVWSLALTIVAFVVVGVLKGRVVGLPATRSALRTLSVGGAAALVAFGVGFLLRDLV